MKAWLKGVSYFFTGEVRKEIKEQREEGEYK